MTRAALARKSLAMTGAPLKGLPPLTIALGPFDFDVRAKAGKFANVHEARFENSFGDDADARRQCEQRHHLRLGVGGIAGIRQCGDIRSFQFFPAT